MLYEREKIGTRIVPRHIELPTRSRDALRIDLAEQEPLLLVQRAGDDLAIRIDDHAVARVHPSRRRNVYIGLEAQAVREIGRSHRTAAADDVHAALLGDVAERRDPRLTSVPGRSGVDVHTIVVQGLPRERHVVLPADQAAEPPDRGIVGPERRTLSLRVHETFASRRDQLSMNAEQLALVADEQHGIVE